MPQSYEDPSLPLGDHLLPGTVEKIYRGNYMDVLELQNREQEEKMGIRRDLGGRNQRGIGPTGSWVFSSMLGP